MWCIENFDRTESNTTYPHVSPVGIQTCGIWQKNKAQLWYKLVRTHPLC